MVGAEAASSAGKASGKVACSAILAAKASSTRLASSADKRFLAFRMAIARACRSSSGRVSISWMSWALIAADSSAPSFSRTGGVVRFPAWNWLDADRRRAGIGSKASSYSPGGLLQALW